MTDPRSFPRPLRSGDVLSCVAPAGPVDPDRFRAARERLEAQGFRIRTYRDVTARHGLFAGDDATRARELMDAFSDPESAAVLPIRGGYGCTRVVPRLDFEVLRNHPKIFAGFSDNTVLHAAFQARCDWITFHTPHLSDGIGAADGWTALTEFAYWKLLWPERDPLAHREFPWTLPLEKWRGKLTSHGRGAARGRLIGGNLAVMTALLGTPFAFPSEGRILFLEDLGERPYRIDRYLSQLRLSGDLARVAGVILGQFTDCESDVPSPNATCADVLNEYFGGLGVPVVGNFPAGHTADHWSLPLNVEVEVDADHQRVTIMESPYHE